MGSCTQRVGLALLCLAAVGCAGSPQPIRVGSNVWPGYEPLYLAQKQGQFDGQPIELISFPSTAEVMRAYRYGSLDVAATTADEALTLVESLPEQRVILVCDFSSGADALLARPELESLAQLRGRRIGYEPNALGAYVLARALEVAGLEPADVVPVPVQLEEHERAYLDNAVDAIITFEPRRTHLLAKGARSLFDSAAIPGEIVDVLVTRNALLDSHRKPLQALVDGWFRARAFVQAHPRQAAELAAERERLQPDDYQAALRGLELPDREANQRLLGGSQASLGPSLSRLASVMTQHKLLSHAIDSSRLLDDRFVKAAPP